MRTPSAKPGTRNPELPCASERGVALVMTLSILAIMLVLVVSFATLSRTEVGSSANYRDYVASKYLAQGGLNRAMAEIAYAYSASSNSFNTGLGSIYSAVDTNGTLYSNLVGVPLAYATDIERVVTNTRTGQVYSKRGADNRVDAVILPSQVTNAAYTTQWIGMKDTNGVLVGRVAYIVTAGGLNINAMGNLLSSTLPNGMKENARNEGQSVAELNLPAALMAINSTASGWDFAAATNDLRQILVARYVDGFAGNPGDDDGNNTVFQTDGIDNNGNGQVDELNEGIDEPHEALSMSDGTTSSMIQPAGSGASRDTIITDLKQLHDGSIGTAASQARFRDNFSSIRRWFTTQSTLPVSPSLISLNDTAVFPTDTTGRQAFFAALTNRFALINFPTNNLFVQAQAAANIATYAWPAADDAANGNPGPFLCTINNTNVIGVGRVPFINQVDFEFIARVDLVIPSTTNVEVTLSYRPKVELWYPYTNLFNATAQVLVSNRIYAAGGPTYTSTVQTPTASDSGGFAACSFSQITNASRFHVVVLPTVTVGAKRIWTSVPVTPINVPLQVTNIVFATQEAWSSSPNPIWDAKGAFSTNLTLVFSTNLLMQVTNGGWVPRTVYFTNVISYAMDDPRVKQWYVEYAGLVTNSTIRTSLGGPNLAANLLSDSCVPPITAANPLFRPDLGEDADFVGQVGQGIGPATFFVKHRRTFSSIAELGRIHRGQPWRTIDFKGGGTDGNLLDYFTTVSNQWGGSALTYAHGRVNINARSDATPIWAALFAGMPYRVTQDDGSKTSPVLFDYSTGANPQIDPNLPESKEMGKIFGSRAGSITHLGALTAVTDLSNLASNHASVFPTATFARMRTDEDKEYLLGRLINLVGTQGQGNTFTIYAWGQSLRGPPAASFNTNRFVTAETLIVAMVRPELDSQTPPRLSLKLIYYRYNPDLELNQGF